jgi:hypothetical protein
MTPNLVDRLLLMQAMIVRRVPMATRITSIMLMERLQEDHQLVAEKAPHYYFSDDKYSLSGEVQSCVDIGLIEDGTTSAVKNRWTMAPTPRTYKRTAMGDQFLRTLEDRFQQALDDMPMSDKGLLDFLSLI